MTKSAWEGIASEDIIRAGQENAMSKLRDQMELLTDELEGIIEKHFEIEHEVDYDDYGRPVPYSQILSTDEARMRIIHAIENYLKENAEDIQKAYS